MSSLARSITTGAIALLWCLASQVGCGPATPAHTADADTGDESPRRALPSTRLERLDGEASSLAEFSRGRVMVIDMWASWCVACKDVSARVERLADAYSENSALVVVGVNVGEDRAKVERFIDGPPALPTFLDAEFVFTDTLGARELPVVLIVDRRGQIVYQGKTLDERALSQLKRLLES